MFSMVVMSFFYLFCLSPYGGYIFENCTVCAKNVESSSDSDDDYFTRGIALAPRDVEQEHMVAKSDRFCLGFVPKLFQETYGKHAKPGRQGNTRGGPG